MINKYTSKVIFVIGVSGSGKTTVGQLLAEKLHWTFVDADDHHPPSNIEKMKSGIPLNDTDRLPWLDALHQIALDSLTTGCVISCSALKENYRERLSDSIVDQVAWVYLEGSYDLIYERMQNRENHFMDANMLKSQFEAFEKPEDAMALDIADAPEIIVEKIINRIT